MHDSLQTPRTTAKRRPTRAAYERAVVDAILDEALVAHVGFSVDDQPYVLPMVYGRSGDRLYLHGSAASRQLTHLASGVSMCVTVTLVDGLVLARSAFHHSMNYRSVVLLGVAKPVVDSAEKQGALAAIVEHVVPGRTSVVRAPNEKELKATLVLVMPISEGSAKIRTGPPLDDPEDLTLPCWAGEIPLRLAVSPAVDAPDLRPGITAPDVIAPYRRAGRSSSDPSRTPVFG